MLLWWFLWNFMHSFVSSNPVHGKVYSIQHYVIKFVSNLWQVLSTNKTDCHDLTEILLKVVLNTINQAIMHSLFQQFSSFSFWDEKVHMKLRRTNAQNDKYIPVAHLTHRAIQGAIAITWYRWSSVWWKLFKNSSPLKTQGSKLDVYFKKCIWWSYLTLQLELHQ